MRRLIMLFLFQGCLRLSFKNWTGLRCGLTMDRIAGLQNLQDRLFWLSCGLTMDRMEGWKVLQERFF
jgi:hypothetical protein